MRIHSNNSLEEKGNWLKAQLRPGQLIETSKNDTHKFVSPETKNMVYAVDNVWVMVFSTSSSHYAIITVIHDGRLMETSIFGFLEWFDSQEILPRPWKDMLEW